MSSTKAKGNLGFFCHFRPCRERGQYTLLLQHGSSIIGIWGCRTLGTSREGLQLMSGHEFDVFCSGVLLMVSGGLLTT